MDFLQHNWEHILAGLGVLSILLHAIEAGCQAAGWTKYQGIFSQIYKFIQGFLGNVKPPASGASAAIIILLFLTTPVMADVTSILTDGLTAKQAVLYIPKDAKTKNFTAFSIISTKNEVSGKWAFLANGWSLDAGIDYDALGKVDGGAVALGKDINGLLDLLPVDYSFKDKIKITAYVAGDSISKDGDKVVNKFAVGGAYVQASIKF